MKRTIIYLVAGLFLLALSSDVNAVEKKDKKKEQPVVNEKNQKPSRDSSQQKTPAVEKKKYDDFVDKNKNGIDDRKENLKEKPEADEPKADPEKP